MYSAETPSAATVRRMNVVVSMCRQRRLKRSCACVLAKSSGYVTLASMPPARAPETRPMIGAIVLEMRRVLSREGFWAKRSLCSELCICMMGRQTGLSELIGQGKLHSTKDCTTEKNETRSMSFSTFGFVHGIYLFFIDTSVELIDRESTEGDRPREYPGCCVCCSQNT